MAVGKASLKKKKEPKEVEKERLKKGGKGKMSTATKHGLKMSE